jgi:hypothetical protein
MELQPQHKLQRQPNLSTSLVQRTKGVHIVSFLWLKFAETKYQTVCFLQFFSDTFLPTTPILSWVKPKEAFLI